MRAAQARPSTFSIIVDSANPVFILLALGLPIGGLVYAMNFGSTMALNFVHIMTGALWTGIDLFMGFVLGPVLGGMEPRERVSVFKRLVPKMTFLMPALATTATTSGLYLALRLGYRLDRPLTIAAIIVVALLTIQGFGLLLPNEIRVFRQLVSKTPDIDKISRLGMMNARLGGVQGILQLAIIFMMALLRF